MLALQKSALWAIGLLATAACGNVGSSETQGLAEAETVGGERPYQELAMGAYFGCELAAGGAVYCQGDNLLGQLGNGNTTSQSTPGVVLFSSGAMTYVTAGSNHACGITSGGAMSCWGYNNFGQLGNNTTTNATTEQTVLTSTGAALSNVVAGAGGWYHTCALDASGSVWCWGTNTSGQLGDGTTVSEQHAVNITSGVEAVAAGCFHTCALMSDHTVKCWGANDSGQIGDGTTTQRHTPTAVTGLSNVSAISATCGGTCAQLSDGSLKCWGYGTDGELGNNTTSSAQTTPTNVLNASGASNLTGVTAFASGHSHNCAILSGGTAYCWGNNSNGQLGDNTTSQRNLPVQVSSMGSPASLPVHISAGYNHTCAKTYDGKVYCWGWNNYGELGTGNTSNSLTPVQNTVPAYLASGERISIGDYHSCILTANGGNIQCFGNNSNGQLGDGTTSNRNSPTSVSGISDAVSVAAGYKETCAILQDGSARCWGWNGYGQLGNNTTTDSATPVTVSGLSNAVSISAGFWFACAATASGNVECWGGNGSGQLGDGTSSDHHTPVTVTGISNAIAVSTGSCHACALLSSGGIDCWGCNSDGRLGNGTTTASSTPVSVSGISTAIALATSDTATHMCALLVDGTAKCWGSNAYGELGDGTTTNRLTPVAVSSLSNAVALSIKNYGSMALTAGGTTSWWGFPTSGGTQSTTPVVDTGLTYLLGMSLGGGDVEVKCGVKSNDTVWCLGDNTYGGLGTGNNTSSTAWVQSLASP